VIAATVFEVVVIFVLAEALPKNWAVQNPERSALLLAPIVSAIVRFPPIRLISRALIGLANMLLDPGAGGWRERIGAPGHGRCGPRRGRDRGHERELIHSIIEFGDTGCARSWFPSRHAGPGRGSIGVRALGVAIEAGLSRLPVHGGNIDDIAGVAHAKDLIRAEREDTATKPVRDFVRPAHFVPETKRVARLMRRCRTSSTTWPWWSTSTGDGRGGHLRI